MHRVKVCNKFLLLDFTVGSPETNILTPSSLISSNPSSLLGSISQNPELSCEIEGGKPLPVEFSDPFLFSFTWSQI